jgi:hypothetical protein
MLDFNKIVNKLSKKKWKIIFKTDIFNLIDPDLNKKNNTKVAKIIYRLLGEKKILKIRNWVYIIPLPEDFSLNEIDLIEKYFFSLVKKYISKEVSSYYFISWDKALEFNLRDLSIRDKIYVINRNINKKIKIWDYEIIFKTITSNKNWKKINLYNKFSKFTKTFEVDNITLRASNLELALLESCTLNDIYEDLDLVKIKKALKKYKKVLDKDILDNIIKYKYIVWANRLKELSKTIDKDLSDLFLELIKNNWGNFVGRSLRRM